MKKIIALAAVALTLFLASCFTVSAKETELYDLSGVYDALSDDVKERLEELGTDTADADKLSSLSFDAVINEIAEIAGENSAQPLKGLVSVIASLLICSMFTAYRTSLGTDISSALNIVCALCLSGAVAFPAAEIISSCSYAVNSASTLMLAYAPVIVAILSYSGNAVSSGVYYTSLVLAGEGIMQLSSKIILPLLNMLLGLGISSGISGELNLKGFVALLSKAVRYLLTFGMTVFTAVLSVRQVISSSLDTVSGRAVKFALGSFVPVVGSALSDAYRTVQGSMSVLKSGVGVFVIIAVALVLLPLLIRCVMWQLTLWIGKSTAEALNLPQAANLLDSISSVFSVVIAVLLCFGAVYIIASAAVFSLGGAVV